MGREPRPIEGVLSIDRTGPLGRAARLVLAIVFAVSFLSIFDWRELSARFRNPHILDEPSAWVLHFVMFVIFITLVGTLAEAVGWGAKRRWQLGAIFFSAATVAVAMIIGRARYGSIWGFPLADLVWWFDVFVLTEQFVALLLASILGTPGCEIGVWPELVARARGDSIRTQDGLACIVGLHQLDRWEARRRATVGR